MKILQKIMEVFVTDCLPPLLVAFALWAIRLRPFWETAAFFCFCDILIVWFVEHFDWKFQHRLTRQILAPLMVPGVVLWLMMLPVEIGIMDVNVIELGNAWIAYFTFLTYRVGLAFAEPAINLMIYGPCERTLRGETKLKLQHAVEYAVQAWNNRARRA